MENGILLPTLQSALPFLDLHGTPRLEFHQSVFDELRDKLMERVATIAEGKDEDRCVIGWLWLWTFGKGTSSDASVFFFSIQLQIWEAWRVAGEELSTGQNAIHSTSGDAGAEASPQGKSFSKYIFPIEDTLISRWQNVTKLCAILVSGAWLTDFSYSMLTCLHLEYHISSM